MNAKELLKLLHKNKFIRLSQKGSHIKLSDGNHTVIVPLHGSKDIPLGTLKNIEKQSGVKLH